MTTQTDPAAIRISIAQRFRAAESCDQVNEIEGELIGKYPELRNYIIDESDRAVQRFYDSLSGF